MTRFLKLCLAPAAITLTLAACTNWRLNSAPNPGQASAETGMHVWRDKGCYGCHGFGKQYGGPDLAGIMDRRDHDWLRKWLKDTRTMLEGDPQAIAMMKDWKGARMPNMKLSDQQIDALFAYFAQETARVRGGGAE